jgi:multisubunit Na+/H+ antiporter MnhE subunit
MADRPTRSRAASWLAWWVLLAGLYLLLADSVTGLEPAACVLSATLGATATQLVARYREVILRPRAGWLLAAARQLLGLFTDLVPLTRTLVTEGILRHPSASRMVELPFPIPAGEREAASRIAFTEALGSLAPNTLVVEIDRERERLLAHELRPTSHVASRAAPLRP